MNQKEKKAIVQTLKDKGMCAPCPRCYGKEFEIIDQTNLAIPDSSTVVPAVMVICTVCGFISLHGLGILGLLPKEE